MKRAQDRKFLKESEDNVTTSVSKRTGRGRKRMVSEVETDQSAQELNLGGSPRLNGEGEICAQSSGQSAQLVELKGEVGLRRTEGGRRKPRGRKGALGQFGTCPASHEVNPGEAQSRYSACGSGTVVFESCGLAPSGPDLKVQEVGKGDVSSEGRPFKRRKLHCQTLLLKRGGAVEKTYQADQDRQEVKKFASKEGEDSEEADRRQLIKWKLELRPALKKILEKDGEIVTKQGKRHRLPASPNIIQLLDKFVKDASLRHLSALEKLQSR